MENLALALGVLIGPIISVFAIRNGRLLWRLIDKLNESRWGWKGKTISTL